MRYCSRTPETAKSKDLTVTSNRDQATKSGWRELAQAHFEAALVRGSFSKDARRLTHRRIESTNRNRNPRSAGGAVPRERILNITKSITQCEAEAGTGGVQVTPTQPGVRPAVLTGRLGMPMKGRGACHTLIWGSSQVPGTRKGLRQVA